MPCCPQAAKASAGLGINEEKISLRGGVGKSPERIV